MALFLVLFPLVDIGGRMWLVFNYCCCLKICTRFCIWIVFYYYCYCYWGGTAVPLGILLPLLLAATSLFYLAILAMTAEAFGARLAEPCEILCLMEEDLLACCDWEARRSCRA